MLQHPDFERYDLSSLVRIGTGGASVPVSLIEQVTERIGASVCNFYGQTEASPFITKTLPDDPFELQATTVGLPLPHSEVKLVSPANGGTVPLGARGECCCRGYQVMAGYYQMSEQTRAAIDSEGWLHTGDLATMDARGYLSIVGRLKEMVIRGGENIFPREIEEFLLRHPQVGEVYVVGVPDAFFGEELLAVVRLKEGVAVTEQDLRAFCKGQISHQKVPRYFQFVDAFPMTASGKVQKFILRERAIQALGLQEVANNTKA
jgi:fatty-acyl-CoA synthase